MRWVPISEITYSHQLIIQPFQHGRIFFHAVDHPQHIYPIEHLPGHAEQPSANLNSFQQWFIMNRFRI
ncbi:hypothetical protein SDC9_126978 [bioreactor metagenome]|uniref:Uncharacterized protein n=1 Tax=bioreactor metagenome TaxID=1076179 RepID=A0A645CSR6_9ZZZZ